MKKVILVRIMLTVLTSSVAISQLIVSQASANEHLSESALSSSSFSKPSSHLTSEERMSFTLGSSLFNKIWVSSPSSTTASDGLGPLYNARSCQSCHAHNGRGQPTMLNSPEDMAVSMIVRLSIPAQSQQQRQMLSTGQMSVIPEPTYGTQLQDFSVAGLAAEGRVKVHYRYFSLSFADNSDEHGDTVSLRKPEYYIEQLGYGSMQPNTQMSARVAPPIIGLGLLEMISEEDILANQDPDDIDNDGISGRVNRVWDIEKQQSSIGRFGWKAGNPTLKQQNNSALQADIGISTPMFPDGAGECTIQQTHCQALPNGNSSHLDNVEASAQMVDLITFYTRNLAVPIQRNKNDTDVLNGEKIFSAIGCQRCHIARYLIKNDSPSADIESTIEPYTDLLLHDMGDGLADNREEFLATGREWRTPPLWGIGQTLAVSGHTQFLHDGRARNLLEAILWHGGEAEASKHHFMQLSSQNRHNLISFLESL